MRPRCTSTHVRSAVACAGHRGLGNVSTVTTIGTIEHHWIRRPRVTRGRRCSGVRRRHDRARRDRATGLNRWGGRAGQLSFGSVVGFTAEGTEGRGGFQLADHPLEAVFEGEARLKLIRSPALMPLSFRYVRSFPQPWPERRMHLRAASMILSALADVPIRNPPRSSAASAVCSFEP
jgi:hypothetical protein